MSEDTLDDLIVDLVEWVEELQPVDFDDNETYEVFRAIIYSKLERFCTKERNYN